jgi:hypothetical protein
MRILSLAYGAKVLMTKKAYAVALAGYIVWSGLDSARKSQLLI